MKKAFTLLELLVSMAIVAVLISLIMTVVVRARTAASMSESKNKLRQLGIAYQQFVSDYPTHGVGYRDPNGTKGGGICPIGCLFAYLDGELSLEDERILSSDVSYWRPTVCIKADPGFLATRARDNKLFFGPTSYSFNLQAFVGRPTHTGVNFSDGFSTTISYAERFALYPLTENQPDMSMRYVLNIRREPGATGQSKRRCTFADEAWGDPYPITDANGITRSSQPGVTFDISLSPTSANRHVPNAFHRQGLNAAFFDGSVQTLARNISETTYWSMITRNWNDVTGAD